MPCLIVGTQTDLRDDPAVKDKLAKQKMQPVRKEDGEKMARELGAIKYVECSALTQYKLKDVFDEVCIDTKREMCPILLTCSAGNCCCTGTASPEEEEEQRMYHSVKDRNSH